MNRLDTLDKIVVSIQDIERIFTWRVAQESKGKKCTLKLIDEAVIEVTENYKIHFNFLTKDRVQYCIYRKDIGCIEAELNNETEKTVVDIQKVSEGFKQVLDADVTAEQLVEDAHTIVLSVLAFMFVNKTRVKETIQYNRFDSEKTVIREKLVRITKTVYTFNNEYSVRSKTCNIV